MLSWKILQILQVAGITTGKSACPAATWPLVRLSPTSEHLEGSLKLS